MEGGLRKDINLDEQLSIWWTISEPHTEGLFHLYTDFYKNLYSCTTPCVHENFPCQENDYVIIGRSNIIHVQQDVLFEKNRGLMDLT